MCMIDPVTYIGNNVNVSYAGFVTAGSRPTSFFVSENQLLDAFDDTNSSTGIHHAVVTSLIATCLFMLSAFNVVLSGSL